jgi:hypothetical protein
MLILYYKSLNLNNVYFTPRRGAKKVDLKSSLGDLGVKK